LRACTATAACPAWMTGVCSGLDSRLGDRLFAPAGAVACHGLLDVASQVVPQVPAIGDLDRLGCALRAPSASAPARSRPMTWVPGWSRSQAAKVSASLGLGSRSTGRSVACPRARCRRRSRGAAQSRPRPTRPRRWARDRAGRAAAAAACCGQPGARALWASRAPARPASARPIASSIPRASGLRRAYGEVRPVICSANVLARQSLCHRTTDRPTAGPPRAARRSPHRPACAGSGCAPWPRGDRTSDSQPGAPAGRPSSGRRPRSARPPRCNGSKLR
jgi:hypothetical protein